ncbi:hypothetical protein L1987_44811 [Smallanthus sonchifolius]|uniref:Uncharacterized protein n=1 Tax=Smallanthus sonchifolius TaxID=185202 RepID=A0ACB9GQK6_9ASTR|nr:hypothetical protein L1987_44811 [Smallanthus sonchifolius]
MTSDSSTGYRSGPQNREASAEAAAFQAYISKRDGGFGSDNDPSTKPSHPMKEKQEICQEKVISVDSPKKPSEGVSANMKQHDNSKPIALKSEKPANSGGSDSVEIISFGANFSPYKSQFEREFMEEMRHFEKQGKRKRALMNWKWDDVVDINSSDDEVELIDMTQPLFESAHYESDSSDTADSVTSFHDVFKNH